MVSLCIEHILRKKQHLAIDAIDFENLPLDRLFGRCVRLIIASKYNCPPHFIVHTCSILTCIITGANIRTLTAVKEIVGCIDRYAITIRRANTRCTYAIGTYFPHTTNFPTLPAVGGVVRRISRYAIAIRRACAFDTTDDASTGAASGTDRTKVVAPTAIRRIVGRIDFHVTAIHHAIACFACTLATY